MRWIVFSEPFLHLCQEVQYEVFTIWGQQILVVFCKEALLFTHILKKDREIDKQVNDFLFSKNLKAQKAERGGDRRFKQAYFHKKGAAYIKCSAFQWRVYEHLLRLSSTRVMSYQELAERCGSPQAARCVGNFMAKNPLPLLIPCHRVVPSKGGVGNYRYGTQLKKRLLKEEGLSFAFKDKAVV